MSEEEIENYITELESMFELSELEEHSRNILKVGIYIKELQKENQQKENQQKEFIEWLTNEANINPYDISDYIYENIINAILSKYNGIIGSDSK